MASKKHKLFFSWKECPVRIACDGTQLRDGREVCRKCTDAEKRRRKVIPPRGEAVR